MTHKRCTRYISNTYNKYIYTLSGFDRSACCSASVRNKDHMGRVITQKVTAVSLPSEPLPLSHLLTSVHLLTVPVTVAGVGVHADQRTPRVGLVTRGNCQGWEGWWRGEGCRHQCPHSHIFIQTPEISRCTRHASHAATCDGVEYFFGKGGIYRVAMASNRNHRSGYSHSYTEVISRALVGVQKGERTYLKGKISESYYFKIHISLLIMRTCY